MANTTTDYKSRFSPWSCFLASKSRRWKILLGMRSAPAFVQFQQGCNLQHQGIQSRLGNSQICKLLAKYGHMIGTPLPAEERPLTAGTNTASEPCTSRGYILTGSASACSTHLDEKDDDPSVGARFSVETLWNGQEKGLHSIPSNVHGAPITAEVPPPLSMLLPVSHHNRCSLSADAIFPLLGLKAWCHCHDYIGKQSSSTLPHAELFTAPWIMLLYCSVGALYMSPPLVQLVDVKSKAMALRRPGGWGGG